MQPDTMPNASPATPAEVDFLALLKAAYHRGGAERAAGLLAALRAASEAGAGQPELRQLVVDELAALGSVH